MGASAKAPTAHRFRCRLPSRCPAGWWQVEPVVGGTQERDRGACEAERGDEQADALAVVVRDERVGCAAEEEGDAEAPQRGSCCGTWACRPAATGNVLTPEWNHQVQRQFGTYAPFR